ncbi:cysteine--tRNA ligase [Archaeoglobus veneficus]|uniref:Cysteine--tRNA ligase n=1 Tax=Archaeoglobus veneficus (strain DSM 11195 / SNP6) TaxID=693661 RepID=F2KSV7_ARCVS|nr:cysteine--tRNA ligase [Archaeoglobus veneficus]AEA47002.1 cysteinyl-tRNA synthetase [Archaeoglobus veneficus SNP6]
MRLYNTLTKREEELKLDKTVRIYVCGITAYDYSHIGHARSAVIFDTFRRYLEWKGHEVIYVQNFTDVDDKIVRRAVAENRTQKEVAEKFIAEYFKDMEALNVRKATYHPKVTEHISDIIQAVSELIKKGYAYEVGGENKDVYFHVPSFSHYGELSGMSLEELNRHRIEPDERKKDVKDFALWKAAKEEDIKAKAVFDSPWGLGRPGWHIECSVMAAKYLGIPFDIHGGGKDLIFPHHENERAQSYALHGIEPVRYWIHNDFVTIKGEKMSKSLGNIVKIRDVLQKYNGEVLRYFLLSAHYRSPIDYSEESIERAEKAYSALRNTLELIDMEIAAFKTFGGGEGAGELNDATSNLSANFISAMENDFNTPKAIASLHEFSTRTNKAVNKGLAGLEELENAFETFLSLCNVLGIFVDYQRVPVLSSELAELVKEREEARREKNFEKADRIREKLRERGYVLIDTPRGTRWKLV